MQRECRLDDHGWKTTRRKKYWQDQFINNEKQIKVIEQVPLARDKAVFLIKYRDNEYIIATTPQNIEIIDKIKSEEMDNYGN